MIEINKIQLKLSTILNVPFQSYEKDFSFIVNGEEFKTNRFISDLLSPYLSKVHQADPTMNAFAINTDYKGNFSHILNLINFQQNDLPEEELPFVCESLKILGNDSVDIIENNNSIEITNDNIFDLIRKHEKIDYSKRLLTEIDYFSSHFYELCESHSEEIKRFKVETLYSILVNRNLQMKDEDQLLKLVNQLYLIDSSYSILYETVFFSNVSSHAMEEFINIYNYQDLTAETWKRISERFSNENQKKKLNFRYKAKKRERIQIPKQENEEFVGIINYLMKKSSNQIDKEIDFTSSSSCKASKYQPINVAFFDDRNRCFESQSQPDSWICLDFKDNRVIPTHYTIRSSNWDGKNWIHPKSWVIEASKDKNTWITLDEQKNCNFLNGKSLIHTFSIKNQLHDEFKFIRMRSTGVDWANYYYLLIDSIEFYGTLI